MRIYSADAQADDCFPLGPNQIIVRFCQEYTKDRPQDTPSYYLSEIRMQSHVITASYPINPAQVMQTYPKPPELVEQLVKHWIVDGYDVVYTAKAHRDNESALRRLAVLRSTGMIQTGASSRCSARCSAER